MESGVIEFEFELVDFKNVEEQNTAVPPIIQDGARIFLDSNGVWCSVVW